MKIRIDGKEITVSDASKNIVEIAEENGITITAPCFRNKRKGGCCRACVIEVNGKVNYACATKPRNGMDITYNRKDLGDLRKDRLKQYAESVKSGNKCSCSGGCSDNCC